MQDSLEHVSASSRRARARHWHLAGVALASVGWHAVALAADPPETVELPSVEVVGTTPIDGVGVPLSKFPANAQKLTSKDVSRQGASTLADLLNNNLGQVSVSDGTGNPYQNDVNYRGFQASSLLGAPVGISVYFDGARMNEPFGSVVNWDLIPMNAIASVSILPGSNPIFGLNTLGGALVVHTKNGKDDSGTSIGLLGGSFKRRAVTFETGWADAAHGMDVFIAGNVDRQNGFREYSGSDVKQLYGKARWEGNGGKTQVELSTALAQSRLRGTQSLPQDMMSDTSAAYSWPDSTVNKMALLNLKLNHRLDGTNHFAANAYYRNADSHNGNSNAGLDDGCFNADGSLATTVVAGVTDFKCADKAPNGTAVNSIAGANAQALGYGRWTSSINTSLVDSLTKQQTVGSSVQWTNMAKLADHANTFLFGAAFDQSQIDYSQSTYLAKLVNYQTVIGPNQAYGFTANGAAPSSTNLPAFTGSNVLSGVNLTSKSTDLSAYFTDTFNLTDKLSATASGSFNDTSIRQDGANNQYLNHDGGYSWTDSVSGVSYYNPTYVNAYSDSNSGTGATASALGIPTGYQAGPETNSLYGVHHYRRFNPALGFNYNLDSHQGFFGNYSESMRAPTSVELSCADPNSPCALPTGFNGDPDLKPVVARTVELGGRGRLGGQISWNAAVYDSRLHNDIQFIATSSTYGYFANVGDTERRGVELGVSGKLDQLFLSANYGYVNAIYKSAFTTASGENVVSGNKIPGIPSQTLKVRTTYAVNSDLSIGGNLVVVSSQYSHGNESNSDPTARVAGYGLVNLDLHFKFAKGFELSLNVNNLLDRKYSTYGLAGMTSIYTLATQQFFTPAPPRAVWLGLTYAFGGKGTGRDAD